MKQVTVIRAVIELLSPMAISSGRSDDLRDAMIVTDASGLPMIPGTSLAGVLRAAWGELYGEEQAQMLFGEDTNNTKDDDQALDSCVSVSHGVLHQEDDEPVMPSQLPSEMSDFVRGARSVTTRQHVRINEYGAAANRGLFDRNMVPKGHRFTIELRCNWPKEKEEAEKRGLDQEKIPTQLLELLHSPFVALGARSRAGLGQFALVRARMRHFDLTKLSHFEDYCSLPVALWRQDEAKRFLPELVDLKTLPLPQQTHWVTLELGLQARKSWLIAGGDPQNEDERIIQKQGQQEKKVADMVPWREASVGWSQNEGSYDPTKLDLAVPGSSVKGPLRHRTAFYLNALQGHFADLTDEEQQTPRAALDAQNNKGLWTLFGGVEIQDGTSETEGGKCAGKLFVEDVQLVNKGIHGFQDHVTLDRFMGGALSGHLFDEAFRWGGTWRLKIHIKDADNEVPQMVRQAFARTLEDLKEGCLQIGAGDARGHGRFKVATLKWSDKGEWLNGAPTQQQEEAA